MGETRRWGLGELVEECVACAYRDWRYAKAPNLDAESASNILNEHTTTQLLHQRGGVLNVTVTCGGQRIGDTEAYFWRFKRSGDGTYVYVGGTLDL